MIFKFKLIKHLGLKNYSCFSLDIKPEAGRPQIKACHWQDIYKMPAVTLTTVFTGEQNEIMGGSD